MSMCIRPRDSRFSDSRRASASASPPGSAPGPRDRYPVSTTLPRRGFVFRDFIRGKHHIHGIPDIPMNQTPRDGFPCRDFPNRSDLLHASLQMDGPDPYRGFGTFEVLVPSTSGMSISLMRQTPMALDLRHVSSANGRSRSLSGFRVSRFPTARVSHLRKLRFSGIG
jgi:hypothetical protein